MAATGLTENVEMWLPLDRLETWKYGVNGFTGNIVATGLTGNVAATGLTGIVAATGLTGNVEMWLPMDLLVILLPLD